MSSARFITLLCAVLTGAHSRSLADHADHCSVSFQQAFKETLEIKRSCASAVYKDCCQVSQAYRMFGSTPQSGVFDISDVCQTTSSFTQALSPMEARCDLESNNGGWIVLIRRTGNDTENQDFTRTWAEYEDGFGDLNGEFFYGLKNMHCLTTHQEMEVEIEYSNDGSEKEISSYGNFVIQGPSTNYRLDVSGHLSGGTYISSHNGIPFTTTDRDNDRDGNNCANVHRGGWWFGACYHLSLTDTQAPALWKGRVVSYDNAEMRVRPKTCKAILEQPEPTCS